MRLHLIVLDGVFDLGLAALTDTLTTANELAATLADPPAPIEITLVGVRKRVRTAQGLTVPVVAATAVRRPDVVLVPALGAKMPDALAARLDRDDVREAVRLLQRWARAGASVGAACTGTFVVAESGLLDGERATTSWWLAPMFRKRYPAVALDESRMLVHSHRRHDRRRGAWRTSTSRSACCASAARRWPRSPRATCWSRRAARRPST